MTTMYDILTEAQLVPPSAKVGNLLIDLRKAMEEEHVRADKERRLLAKALQDIAELSGRELNGLDVARSMARVALARTGIKP